jgi:hypothetical protein
VQADKFHERARVGALTRSRVPDDPELVEARQNLTEAVLTDDIAEAVSTWPMLRPEQLDRLVLLLQGSDRVLDRVREIRQRREKFTRLAAERGD